jgi:hypothetical protein
MAIQSFFPSNSVNMNTSIIAITLICWGTLAFIPNPEPVSPPETEYCFQATIKWVHLDAVAVRLLKVRHIPALPGGKLVLAFDMLDECPELRQHL